MKIRRLTKVLIFSIATAALSGSAAYQAWAQTNVYCRKPTEGFEARNELTNNIERRVNDVISAVEAVPPDIGRYIATEKEAAFEARSNERQQIVRSNQFYSAYELHDSARKLIEKISAARSSRDVRSYAIALVDVADHQIRFSESFDEYVVFDRKRPSRVIDPQKVREFEFALVSARGLMNRELKCAISEIRAS